MTALDYLEEHKNVIVKYDDNDVAITDEYNLPFNLKDVTGEVNLKKDVFKAINVEGNFRNFYDMPIKSIWLFQDRTL